MQSVIPFTRTIVLPPDAGPGQARIVIGPDLPPPLDTYVVNADQSYAGGLIFYADDPLALDNSYTFLCVIEDTSDQDISIHLGHVVSGAVVEFGPGIPAVQQWTVSIVTGLQTFELLAQVIALRAYAGGITLTTSGAGNNITFGADADIVGTSVAGSISFNALTSAFLGQLAGAKGVTVDAAGIRIRAQSAATEDIVIAASDVVSISGTSVGMNGSGNTIDCLANAIFISANGAGDDIVMTAADDVTITAGDDISLDAGGDIQVQGVRAFLITKMETQNSTATINLAVAAANVPGCLINHTTVTVNAGYTAEIVCDFNESILGANTCIGELLVDGVLQPAQALFHVAGVGDRATVTQNYSGVLAAAGAHTFQLTVKKALAAGTQQAISPHTTLTVIIGESGG